MFLQIQLLDLLIYFKVSIFIFVEYIQECGWDYEGNMSLDYFKWFNECYENWISSYKEGRFFVINVDYIDFMCNLEDMGNIVNQVNGELYGLF